MGKAQSRQHVTSTEKSNGKKAVRFEKPKKQDEHIALHEQVSTGDKNPFTASHSEGDLLNGCLSSGPEQSTDLDDACHVKVHPYITEGAEDLKDEWCVVDLTGNVENPAEENANIKTRNIEAVVQHSTEEKLSFVSVEDYDAVNEEVDDASDGDITSRQTGNRHELRIRGMTGRALLEIPRERHGAERYATLKDSASSACFGSQAQNLSIIVKESSEQKPAAKRRNPQELHHPDTGHGIVCLEDVSNSRKSAEDISVAVSTTRGKDSRNSIATRDPYSIKNGRKIPGHPSDALAWSEVLAREPGTLTCPLKTPPFAPDEEHVCELCGQFFALSEHLQAHTVVHPVAIKYRDIRCAGCGVMFNYVGDLFAHFDVSRKKKGTRCHRCRQWFSTCDDLFRHRQQWWKPRTVGMSPVLGYYGFLVYGREARRHLRRR